MRRSGYCRFRILTQFGVTAERKQRGRTQDRHSDREDQERRVGVEMAEHRNQDHPADRSANRGRSVDLESVGAIAIERSRALQENPINNS